MKCLVCILQCAVEHVMLLGSVAAPGEKFDPPTGSNLGPNNVNCLLNRMKFKICLEV